MAVSRKKTALLDKFKPASKQFEFREYPFYWVSRLGNRYTQEMEKQLKKMGMNITSWRVGMILREHGEISMTEVSTHAVGRLSTIYKTVHRMQEQGLVKITQNDQDGRVAMVDMTESGLKMINQLIEQTSRTINHAFEDMTSDEIQQMNTLLKRVFDNLSA